MSTSFRPRPPTATRSSPIRHSTAYSTIRAVTPSPPGSFDETFQSQSSSHGTRRTSKRAYFDSAQSGFPSGNGRYADGEEAELRRYLFGSDKNPESALQHDGVASGRSSPIRTRSRARAAKMRPYSTPTEIPSYHQLPVHNQMLQEALKQQGGPGKKEDLENDDDPEEHLDWPKTPTSVSRLQEQTAHFPLGTPLTLSPPESIPNLDIPHSGPCLLSGMNTTTQTSAPNPFTQQTPSFPFHQKPSPLPQQEHAAQPTSPLRLHRSIRRKSFPANDPLRHISLSAQSNGSGGTVVSKRCIFSTPGRDELERKKAVVEEDEGPFARAKNVQDLQANRQTVSEGKTRSNEAKAKAKGKKMGLVCGMGGERCNIM